MSGKLTYIQYRRKLVKATPQLQSDYTPHARAERLIAATRFVLAFFSFVAIYLERSTPARHQHITYTLLLAYILYALAAFLLTWRSSAQSAISRLASHGIDLVLFSVFVYLSEGPSSPFFLSFSRRHSMTPVFSRHFAWAPVVSFSKNQLRASSCRASDRSQPEDRAGMARRLPGLFASFFSGSRPCRHCFAR